MPTKVPLPRDRSSGMNTLLKILGSGLAGTLAAQTPALLLQKSDGGTGSYFGTSACYVGDIEDRGRSCVAFGAPFASGGGTGAGAVQVYRADGTLRFTIVGTAYQSLGLAIANAGDVDKDGRPDILVGGNGTVSQTGVMNLYSGADGTLLRHATGIAAGDRFGMSLAGLGDVNGDGYPDYACAELHASGGDVLVWSGKDGTLLRTIFGAAPGEGAGITIANVGDIDGDGVADLGIGLPAATTSIAGGGIARVHSGKTGALLVERSGTTVNGGLGTAIGAVGGDWDGDGRVDFVVGAPGQDDGAGANSGVALVLNVNGTLLARFQGLAGDRLGGSVAGGRDLDGDRIPDVAIGAVGRYVRIWSGAAGHAVLHTLNAFASNEKFACALDLRGDLDGNGFADLAIGASNADPALSGRGYVYDLGHSWLPKVMLNKLGGAGLAKLGTYACFVGDVDGDGRSEVAFAAPGLGTVRVFRADGTLRTTITVGNPTLEPITALAAAGDVNGDGVPDILVGVLDSGAFLAGYAKVYSGVDGSLLRAHQGSSGEKLGTAVAGVGDADGDGYDDYAASAILGLPSAQGYVRVWSGKTGAVIATFPGDAPGELFGFAISGVGDIDGDGVPDLGVGAPRATRRAPQGGLVRVYSGRTFLVLAEKTGNTTNEALGTSVAPLGGDWDGDGLDDYVSSSPQNDDGSGVDAGSVFVFNIAGNVLHRFDGAPGDKFGATATGAGDVDGDGIPDVAGSALGKYVKVFSGAGDHATLHTFTSTEATWGTVLDLRGDLDGDGFADLVVGVPGAGASSEGQGLVYDLDHAGTPARAQTRGRACPTSDGRLPHVDLRGRSALGATLGFRLRGGKSTTPVAMLLGVAMDLALDPYGAPGCTGYVNPVVTLTGTTDAGGRASFPSLTIPFNGALLGLRLDVQFALPDAAANLLGVVLSNEAAFWVGL